MRFAGLAGLNPSLLAKNRIACFRKLARRHGNALCIILSEKALALFSRCSRFFMFAVPPQPGVCNDAVMTVHVSCTSILPCVVLEFVVVPQFCKKKKKNGTPLSSRLKNQDSYICCVFCILYFGVPPPYSPLVFFVCRNLLASLAYFS